MTPLNILMLLLTSSSAARAAPALHSSLGSRSRRARTARSARARAPDPGTCWPPSWGCCLALRRKAPRPRSCGKGIRVRHEYDHRDSSKARPKRAVLHRKFKHALAALSAAGRRSLRVRRVGRLHHLCRARARGQSLWREQRACSCFVACVVLSSSSRKVACALADGGPPHIRAWHATQHAQRARTWSCAPGARVAGQGAP